MPPLRDDALRLHDGRRLAYAEWGEPEGAAVLYFHGTPLSRLYCPDETVTASLGVRLVTADRPGIGRSEVLPGGLSPTGRATRASSPTHSASTASAWSAGRRADPTLRPARR